MKRTLAVWRTCAASVALCVALGANPMRAFAQQAEADPLVSDPIAVQEEGEQTIEEPASDPTDETLQEGSTPAGTPAVAAGTTTDNPATDNTLATDGEPAEGSDGTTTPAEGEPSEADPAQGTEGQTAEGQEPAATDPAADPAQDQGWVREGGATYYYRGGAPLTGEQLLPREDGGGEAWYWLGPDGAMVRSADVYVPAEGGGKWVRCGADGAMLTGEHYANDPAGGHVGWYHFDEQTRAMSFGLTDLPSGKTVFYDKATGVMRFGERCVGGSWYLFENGNGAMVRGWRWLPAGAKWVYYAPEDGRMSMGERYVTDGEQGWCYFDPVTGATTFGWSYHDGAWHYYNTSNGRAFTGERYITDGEQGWCFFNEDRGTLHQGFKYLPQHSKWVYYDGASGRMRFGEQLIDGSWYLFDGVTGAMQTGWRHLPSNGGKWVYYDPKDGKMATGEKYATEGIKGWYYFDKVTGAMQTGWRYLESGSGKWVHYDLQTGRMDTGERYITDGEPGWCLFDKTTGALQQGLRYLPDHNKVVYYDRYTGRMRLGLQEIGGTQVFFDPVTGAMQADGFDVMARAAHVDGLAIPDETLLALLQDGARVRVLGDSICGGWGVSTPIAYGERVIAQIDDKTWHEPADQAPTWVNALRSYLAAHNGTLFNAAVPAKGYDWFDTLEEGLPNGGEEAFDLTIVALGTNDWGKTPEELTAYATSVYAKAQETGGKVLAVLPAPVKTNAEGHEGSFKVHQTLVDTCNDLGIQTIDLFQHFYPAALAAKFATPELYADGVHPTVAGQAVLWNIISESLGII